MARCRLLLILVGLAVTVSNALTVISPHTFDVNSPQSMSTGASTFNVTARMVLAIPLNGCQSMANEEEIAENIVFISGEDCSLETKVRNAQASGATGVVMHEIIADIAGLNYRFFIDPDRADVTIPVVFVAANDGFAIQQLLQNTTLVMATIVSGEPNEWREIAISPMHIFFTVLHCVISVLLALFSAYKLIWYYRHKRTILSVAQLSMLLLILSTLSSLVSALATQISAEGQLPISAVLHLGAILIAWTMLMLSSLVISFYWFEITSRVSPVAKSWSNRLWIPFIVGGSLLLCALVVMLLWIRYFRTLEVLFTLIAIDAATTLAVVILWVIFGIKLRRSLQTAPSRARNGPRFKQLFRLIIASACLLVVVLISVAGGSWIGANPVSTFVVLSVARFALEAAILVQVMMFSTKTKPKKDAQVDDLQSVSTTQAKQ